MIHYLLAIVLLTISSHPAKSFIHLTSTTSFKEYIQVMNCMNNFILQQHQVVTMVYVYVYNIYTGEISTNIEKLNYVNRRRAFKGAFNWTMLSVTSFCSNECLIIHQRDEERPKLSYQVLESAVEIFYSSTNTAHPTLQRQHTFKLHYMPTSCPACLSRITLSDF